MSVLFVVPAGMVGHLRGGLYSEIGGAAQAVLRVVEMPDREERPERYREPLERLDRVRALLDVVGWGETDPPVEVRVDLREHRWALMKALELALLIGSQDLEEADLVDAERAGRGEAPRREVTTVRVLMLREFVSEVEARVGILGANEGTSG
jgi:hypothetical protein